MRKSLLTYTAISALLFGAASCSQEDIVNPSQGDGNVTFTVELPGDMATRAFNDGLSAKYLGYAVYDENDALVTSKNYYAFRNTLTASVSLDLIEGKKYKIAFFAYNSTNSVFTFDAAAKKATIDYSKMTTNNTDYDCFFALEDIEMKGAFNKNVTLTRPVAQVNWGTSDIDLQVVQDAYKSRYGQFLLKTNFKTKAYNTLNLLTGEAEGDPVDVTLASPLSPVNTRYGTFPVDGYDWLKMNYILVPKDQDLINCTLETYNSSTYVTSIEVTNVPVQRNYRTNIYGALLSTKADITVEKEPIFAGYNDQEVWDGTAGTIKADADGNYTINTPSELAAIAKMVNDGNKLQGKTVKLNRDLDLNNINWTPISNATDKSFDGNFDGCGHTIKNLYINQNGKAAAPAGLFGRIWNGTTEIRNLKIEGVTIDVTGCIGNPEAAAAVLAQGNVGIIDKVEVSDVTIKASHYAGGIGGNFYGDVTNCKATDVNISLQFYDTGHGLDYCDKAGGIFGLHGEGANFNISGNSVRNITISGFRDLGGAFGMLHNNNKYGNNTADNVTIIGIVNDTALVDDSQPGNYGGIVGRQGSNVSDEGGNNATNVNIFQPASDVNDISKLQTAINNGGYIQITGDISVPAAEVIITKPTTIHLQQGKSLTLSHSVTNNSELTIEGEGTITGTGTTLISNGAEGNLTINGGNFNLTADVDYVAPIYNEGSITVNGGTFENSNGNALRVNWAMQTPDKTIVINGGTFKSGANYALNLYGGQKPGCKVLIKGGTFFGGSAGGRADNAIEVTIDGGEFIGKGLWHGFCAGAESSGSQNCFVTVNGGFFYGTNGHALCQANQATLTVKGGYVNKTTGFSPAAGFGIVSADKSITVDGVEYKFTSQIVKQ